MGYYTRYELISADEREDEIKARLLEIVGYDTFDDSLKWYDHEDDIAKVSKEYPNVLIRIDGEGEEAGDLWKLAAKNGRVDKVSAEITFRGFNV